MTTEQLQAARAEKWRQKANPLLTIEDAEAWVESIGVALFLPRRTQLQAPAPSFVEAVLGETSATPAPVAIQQAFEMAARLFAAEKATPLNLFGAVSGQPDFLVSQEALPYVFALRGDRDWKRGPREKSSPLVVESWKLLKREGALTAAELRELLGREVTEAAVLRSLCDLWTALRVLPVYAAGEATTWELFESRHQKAMQVGGGMAQATALSALISLYLDAAIAATSDEIEIFLSPLAARSRTREVVHGLTATRQLLTIQMGAQGLLHIAGGLPVFPEIEAPAEAAPKQEAFPPRREGPPFVPRDQRGSEQRRFERPRKPFTPREHEERPRRERPAFGDRPAARDARKPSSGPGGPRREWKPRGEQGEFRPRRGPDKGGYRKPFRKPAGESAGPGAGERPSDEKFPRREWKRPFEKREWKPRREGAQEGRGEFRPRRAEGKGGFGKPYRGRANDRRPDDRRTGDQRPSGKFPPRGRDQDRPQRKEWKPRREEGERKEFRPRKAGEAPERREFKPRPSTGREFKPRPSTGREFKPRPSSAGGFKPRRKKSAFGGRPGTAGKKQFGTKRSFESREGFDRKKAPQRERGGDAERPRKPSSRPGFKGGKGFGPAKSGGTKPSFGAKRASGKPSFGTKRLGGKPSFGKRPNNRKRKKPDE